MKFEMPKLSVEEFEIVDILTVSSVDEPVIGGGGCETELPEV